MWAPDLPCCTRHYCTSLPRCSSPPCSRIGRSLACLLLLPSQTGGFVQVVPHLARSFRLRRGVSCAKPHCSRPDSGSSMGFPQRHVPWLPSMTTQGVPSVAVIGAGAAGLAAGRILREEGLKVTIFEKSRYVGGVWRYKPRDERAPMCESGLCALYMSLPSPCIASALRCRSLYVPPRETYRRAYPSLRK